MENESVTLSTLADAADLAPASDSTDTVITGSEPVEEVVETATNTEVKGSEPSKAEKRIIAEKQRRREAEQEAAYWRGRAESVVQPPVVQAPPTQAVEDIPLPSLENFDTMEEFYQAQTDYTIQKAKIALQRDMEARAQQQKAQEVQATFKMRLDAAAKDDPSLYDTVTTVGRMVNPVVADLVVQSDIGIDLVQYLNNNPKEATRLSNLHPLQAAREIGALEAQIKYKPKPTPPKTVSQAPEPISAVSSGRGAVRDFDPETATMEEYFARNSIQLKRR